MNEDERKRQDASVSDYAWRGRKSSVPDYKIFSFGMDSAHADNVSSILSEILYDIGRIYDLSGLDGVTLSYDYVSALRELDRGFATSNVLTRTSGIARGVAMSPTVIRDGEVRTHLVFDAHIIDCLINQTHEAYGLAFHTVAHEAAHVEVTRAFDKCFPGVTIGPNKEDFLSNIRWQVIKAVWDEYKVCQICGTIGEDPTPGYIENLLGYLDDTQRRASSALLEFWSARAGEYDYDKVAYEIFGASGDLLKYTAYLLGSLSSNNNRISDFPDLMIRLDNVGGWFLRYIDVLTNVLEGIDREYGNWSDYTCFERLGDLAELLSAELGVFFSRYSVGNVLVHPRIL